MNTTGLPFTSAIGFYLGWNGYQNLGDEAIFQAARSSFPEATWLNSDERSLAIFRQMKKDTQWSPLTVGLLGGGTLINTPSDVYSAEYEELCRTINGQVYTFGTGVEDPRIFESLPGWKDQRHRWVDMLSGMAQVGVRGPCSEQLLVDAGLTNVRVVGDPAIGYHVPLADGDYPVESAPRMRIGINYGCPAVPMWSRPDEVQTLFSEFLAELVHEGHEVELFAVWPPDLFHCYGLLRDAGLVDRVKPVLITDTDRYLEYVRRFDCVIALKLHAGVLAMARNIPTLLIEYAPKCKDFAMSVAWEKYIMRADQLSRRGLIDATLAMGHNRLALAKTISTNMARVAEIFRLYREEIRRSMFSDFG